MANIDFLHTAIGGSQSDILLTPLGAELSSFHDKIIGGGIVRKEFNVDDRASEGWIQTWNGGSADSITGGNWQVVPTDGSKYWDKEFNSPLLPGSYIKIKGMKNAVSAWGSTIGIGFCTGASVTATDSVYMYIQIYTTMGTYWNSIGTSEGNVASNGQIHTPTNNVWYIFKVTKYEKFYVFEIWNADETVCLGYGKYNDKRKFTRMFMWNHTTTVTNSYVDWVEYKAIFK